MLKKLLLFIIVLFTLFTHAQTVIQVGSKFENNMIQGFTAPLYRTGNPSTGQQLYSRHFFIYDADELCEAQMPVGTTISKIAWFKNGVGSKDGVVHSFKIYMKNTNNISRNGDTWTNLTNGATKVFETEVLAIPNVDGWWELTLDAPFIYTGGTIEVYTDWFVGGGANGDRTNGLISFGQTTMSGGIDAIRRAGGSAKFNAFTDDEFVGGGLFTSNVTSNLVNVKFTVLGGNPRTEICYNGIDDDCDGQIDEGCPAQYRTKNIGNWTTLNVWEKITNANVGWVQAITIPNQTDLPIAVRHNAITLNTSVLADQLTIDATGVLRLQFPGNLTLNNGTGDDLINKGLFDLQSGSVLLSSGGNLVNDAAITVNAATFVAPVLNKSTGSISFNGASFCAAMTNDGNITWQSGNLTADPSTEFVNNLTGVFNISSDNSYGQGQINNKGVFKKTSAGTTTFNGTVTSTGTIMGVGTYNFSSGLNNSGVIAPGNSIGQLTLITPANPFNANTSLLIELENNSGAGTGNDLLIYNGNLQLAGKLLITELANASAGDYEIIRVVSGTLSGNFSQVPDGYTVKISGNTVVVTKSSGVVTFPGSGNALRFDGVSSTAGVNNNAAFNFALNQNFTVECWVRIPVENQTDVGFTNNVILEKWGSPWGAFPYAIWYYNHNAGANAGRVAFVRDNGAGLFGFVSNITIKDGKYHHIAVQKDGSALRMFVDGISMGSIADRTTGETSNSAPLLMGSSQDLSSTLKGDVDEVRIWNTAISQELIRTWMCKKIKPEHPSFANLVILYNCDQGTSGTTLIDTKGGFNSTLLSGALLTRSGAPIGDVSSFGYGATPTASLTLPEGEKLTATSVPANLTGIHVYAVNSTPNISNGVTGAGSNNRYFGVFPVGSASPQYTGLYEYTGNPHVGPGSIPALFKRNANDVQEWVMVDATHNAAAKTLSFTGISTEYMLGSTGTPLPLTLLTFTGKQNNNYNLLEWSTIQEKNTKQFDIERSTNGTVFENMGTVAARNEPGTHAYSYTDNKQANRESYFYRLKMMDKDGKYAYSGVIYLSRIGLPTFTIFPNPVTEQVTISGLQPRGTIRLISVEGKVLQQQKVSAQNVTLQLGGYAKGTYLLQYVSDDKTVTQKIIKQ